MKKLLLILLLLAGCAKEPLKEDQRVQLSVEGKGVYLITYGTSEQLTVKSQDKWASIFSVYPGDTIQLSVETNETSATLYMGVEIKDGLLFCKSLFVDPQSVGTLNYVVTP
jgi:hypothetical protein